MSDYCPTFVLVDGGLPALVAASLCAAREQMRGGLVLWHPVFGTLGGSGAARARAIGEQAKRLGAVVAPGTEPAIDPTRVLFAAAKDALRTGAERLVWGIQLGWHEGVGNGDAGGRPGGSGPELDRLATEIDRSVLVSRLVSLEDPSRERGVQIDTPVIDLSDGQVADLALDLAAPTDRCWFVLDEAAGDPVADAERERWAGALAGFGGAFAGVGNAAAGRQAAG